MSLDLSKLSISGGGVTSDLSEVLTDLNLDYSTGSVAKLVIKAVDLHGVLGSSPLAVPGTSISWRGEPWQVGALDSEWSQDSLVSHSITCRSNLAKTLRVKYRPSAEKNVSASGWVQRRVQAAQGVAVVQPSSKQAVIAQSSGKERQSDLDVISNLAGDLGWSWVEFKNRLVFGSRYWAWQGGLVGQSVYPIAWGADQGLLSASLGIDADDQENFASGSVSLLNHIGFTIRPWDLLHLTGFGKRSGVYLVDSISFKADGISPVTVQISQPHKPSKKSGSSS